MISRRRFLAVAGAGATSLGVSIRPGDLVRAAENTSFPDDTPEVVAADESAWRSIQQAFTVDRSLINLNSGGISPSTAATQEAMKRYLDYSNTAPVHTMWLVLDPQKETVRQKLASIFGADSEEIAITRNASESLQTCQFGIDMERGDEILASDQEYPRMLNTFRQRQRREGVVLKEIQIPVPAEDPAEVVARYEENITPRTKLILLSHMVYLTGQIMPVKEVVAMARRHQVPVIVDGAHAFAHFPFEHKDLDCDYYGTSLHKWMFAPHGTGMLYVRREKIRDLWPMMAANESMDEDIRKFEEIGTHPVANKLAIAEAIAFHQTVGAERKAARLRYLRNYWIHQLAEFEEVVLNTSLKPEFACGIANAQIKGVDTSQLADYLWEAHQIIVPGLTRYDFNGIRVAPNLFTTLAELDRFADVLKNVIKNGLPATID